MKVIFLDVDGVLNDAYTEDITPEGFIGLDDPMIANLAHIIQQTGALIVLTSSWKEDWCTVDPDRTSSDVHYLMDRLAKHNLKLHDKTCDDGYYRGAGILQWIGDHASQVDRFVVIDDTKFSDFQTCGLLPYFIQTRYGCGGLTRELADQAISILNQKE